MIKIKYYKKQAFELGKTEENFITNYKLHMMVIGIICSSHLIKEMMPYFRGVIINYIVKILYQVLS